AGDRGGALVTRDRAPAICPAILIGGSLLASSVQAASDDQSTLYDTCFAKDFSAAELAAHPGQRVSAMSVVFQSCEGELLASVVYKVRYGTRFGFGGACSTKIEGGFQCSACVNNSCGSNDERFKILWSGGDAVRVVNDDTGMLAKNAQGG